MFKRYFTPMRVWKAVFTVTSVNNTLSSYKHPSTLSPLNNKCVEHESVEWLVICVLPTSIDRIRLMNLGLY